MLKSKITYMQYKQMQIDKFGYLCYNYNTNKFCYKELAMGNYTDILRKNDFYKGRKDKSEDLIMKLKDELGKELKEYEVSIFVVGSIARHEVGNNSDLDIFLISRDKVPNLQQIHIFSKLIEINKRLGFPPFSNDGQFLTIHNLNDLKNKAGYPEDDSLNLFTTRMLMILESKVIYNEKLYREILSEIIEHYLRDRKGHEEFKPLFLLNDILRFWRTLCLNYEALRHDRNRPWRKKNINLKFSRLLTVFSTVLTIINKHNINHNDILDICNKTPLERIAWVLDNMEDDFVEKYTRLLLLYQNFLKAKEEGEIEKNLKLKEQLNYDAIEFANIIFTFLNSEKIDKKLKQYLVI